MMGGVLARPRTVAGVTWWYGATFSQEQPLRSGEDLAGEGLWALSSLYSESLLQGSPAQESAHRRNLRTLLVSLAQATEEAKRGQM